MVTTPTFWGSEVIFANDTNAGASKVTALQDGRFGIVWQDTLGDVHGRRFDALGSFDSTDFLFNMSQATAQTVRLPELVQHENGDMGVYFNLTASARDGDIYINVPDFATVGGRASKATVADRPYDEFMRDVAASTFNNVSATALLINSPRGTTGTNDVYLAYTTTGGLLYGSPQIVSIPTGETVIDASIAGLPNGNTLVTYHTFKASTDENFIRYRVYDDYTEVGGGARHASSTPGNDIQPAATALKYSSDGFVIATQDALGLRFLYSAYGSTFTKSVPGTLSTPTSGSIAIAPEVTALEDGGFIVAWTDISARERDGSPALKIGLQRFDKFANAVGDNVFIDAPGDQGLESIATLADGRVLVTYNTETGDSTGVTRLAYRVLDPRDETIYGTNRADTLVSREDGAQIIAGAGDDTLLGRADADILDGESGVDTMRGAGGGDTYVVDNAGDLVFEAAGGGGDRVNASVSYALAAGQEVEFLGTTDAAGTAAIDLTGNEVAQAIYGNAGANRIDGRGGADTMQGFAGNDTYAVDNSGDRVLEGAGGGTADRVNASVSYVLAAGQQIEILGTTSVAGTTAINLTGNEFAQTIYGNAGANRIDGRGGADTMKGFGGNDTYVVDAGGDRILEASGGGTADRVNASVSYTLAAGQQVEILGTTSAAGTGAINLTGNATAQTIYGNAGANRLDGQGGADTLKGFAGADTFAFTTAPGGGNVDHIADFSAAADTIRLDKSFFPGLALGKLVATAYKDIGNPGATVDANDRIIYNDDTGALYYDSNGSGAGGRVQFAILDNKPATLTNADFFVVA